MIDGNDLDLISAETSILKMDSEICLNYVRRSDLVEKNRGAAATIENIGGVSAEMSQALDIG